MQNSSKSELNLTSTFSKLKKAVEGKSNYITTPQPPQSTKPEVKENEKSLEDVEVKFDEKGRPIVASGEDSVKKDIEKFKKVMSKLGLGVSKKISAKIPKETQVQNISKDFNPTRGVNLLSKILKWFITIIILVVLVYLVFTFIKNKNNTEMRRKGLNDGNGPTPTNIEYQPYIPSIYAEDPEILGFEESISILEKEISSTNIREIDLNPPKLDFNINFQGK